MHVSRGHCGSSCKLVQLWQAINESVMQIIRCLTAVNKLLSNPYLIAALCMSSSSAFLLNCVVTVMEQKEKLQQSLLQGDCSDWSRLKKESWSEIKCCFLSTATLIRLWEVSRNQGTVPEGTNVCSGNCSFFHVEHLLTDSVMITKIIFVC